MTPPGRPVGSLKSLARRLIASIVVAAIVLTFMVTLSLRMQATARSRVVDQIDPYSLAIERLRSALLDQGAGIRGFALEANMGLLEPYLEGQKRADEIAAELGDDFADDNPSFKRMLGEVDEAVDRWRAEVADPLIENRIGSSGESVRELSRTMFDEVRQRLGALDDEMDAEREIARQDLVRATRLLFVALILAFLVTGGGIIVVARYLGRHLMDPLIDLNDRSQRVAAGGADTHLNVDGVTEVRELSSSIATMRNRIQADLVESEAAREQLDRQAEELYRSNRDLEQFAYVASHDLQEPLRKVASFCQLLNDRYGDELDDRGKTYIDFAVDGARRMQALISDLLHFSRVGRTTESFIEVDLNSAVESVLFEHSDLLEESNATVEYEALPTLLGDRSLLTALFSNLIGNSLKYRGAEPPLIRITSKQADDGWDIVVADNGIGISPEYREKVFVIFQRLHARDQYGGTGIGLAMCKKIVEFHGGRIEIVEPATGIGTAVNIHLPAEPPELLAGSATGTEAYGQVAAER